MLSGLISRQLDPVPAISTIPPATVADIADYGHLSKMREKCYKVEKATYNETQTEPNEHTHRNVLLSLLLLSFTEGQTLSVGSKITSVWFCIAHCALELRLALNS